MKNPLVAKYEYDHIWVNYSIKKVGGRDTKVPMKPLTKGMASTTDPSHWGTYDQAFTNDKERIGIVFGPEKKLMGIDIDKCLDKNNLVGDNKEVIAELIIEANTYTEISPSNTGLHLYFELTEPFELLQNRRDNFEVYNEARYFTVSQNMYKEMKPVRTVTPEEAVKILNIIGYPWNSRKKEPIKISEETLMTDEDVLKKMFASKNGAKIKALYNGDKSEYKNDDSSADMALCNSLAFWTNKNYQQIEALWLASPLGDREKTKEREDYRKRTITTAINNCPEGYNPQGGKTSFDGIDFDFLYKYKGKEKVNTLCVENIAKVLRLHPTFKDMLRFDTFKGCVEIHNNKTWLQFEDKDILTLQIKISTLFTEFQTVKKDMVYDAVVIVAHENSIDSAIDYIKSIQWDGVARIDTWLCNTYGVEDNVYHKAIGSNWLKGMVKRIIYPGCKFDYVLVLEGEQGTKKSSSLGVLGGDWHVETTMGTDNKDFFMQFAAKTIIEFSEGETLSRTEVKRMKAIITTQVDKYRAPYERVSKDHPRRCVFAMTTNSSEYLKDETGNRRWWPVATVLPNANLAWLEENRDQLFAEAYKRVIIDKETTWEVPEIEAKEAQDARRISDPNTELVSNWYYSISEENRMCGITTLQVHIEAFGNQFSKGMKKFEEMAIANMLKDDLKLNKVRVMRNGVRSSRWFPKGMTNEEIEQQQEGFIFTADKIKSAFDRF